MTNPGPRSAELANHDTLVAASARRPTAHTRRRWLPMVVAASIAGTAIPACAAPAQSLDSATVLHLEAPDYDAESEGDALEIVPVIAYREAGPLEWISSESEGAARSKVERRPMLVSFATEWCGVCKRIAKETFGDPRVKARAGRFIAVRIDATNDDDPQVNAALLKYAVVGLPTIVLLDSAGHEQRRFTELVRPDTLLAEIDRVH